MMLERGCSLSCLLQFADRLKRGKSDISTLGNNKRNVHGMNVVHVLIVSQLISIIKEQIYVHV